MAPHDPALGPPEIPRNSHGTRGRRPGRPGGRARATRIFSGHFRNSLVISWGPREFPCPPPLKSPGAQWTGSRDAGTRSTGATGFLGISGGAKGRHGGFWGAHGPPRNAQGKSWESISQANSPARLTAAKKDRHHLMVPIFSRRSAARAPPLNPPGPPSAARWWPQKSSRRRGGQEMGSVFRGYAIPPENRSRILPPAAAAKCFCPPG